MEGRTRQSVEQERHALAKEHFEPFTIAEESCFSWRMVSPTQAWVEVHAIYAGISVTGALESVVFGGWNQGRLVPGTVHLSWISARPSCDEHVVQSVVFAMGENSVYDVHPQVFLYDLMGLEKRLTELSVEPIASKTKKAIARVIEEVRSSGLDEKPHWWYTYALQQVDPEVLDAELLDGLGRVVSERVVLAHAAIRRVSELLETIPVVEVCSEIVGTTCH